MMLSTEKKVGLFFLASLIALGVFIEMIEDWNPLERKVSYRTYFQTAVGISEGDPVRLAGVQVGKVTGVGLEDSRVRVDFYVVEGTELKEDSLARIRQTNLLGGQFLGIAFGSPAARDLPPGSPLPSEESTNIDKLLTSIDRNQQRVLGTLGDILEENRQVLTDTVVKLESIVGKIDRGEGTMGRLINDPGLYDDLQGTAQGLKEMLARIESGEGTMGILVNDPTLGQEMTLLVANLRQISDRLNQGQGSLGRILADDRLYTEATDALANIRTITNKVNSGEGSLGRLVHDDSLYEQASGAMTRINSIAGKIDEGEGTLGLLVNEQDLYRDAKTTLNKVEKTVDGMSDSGPLSALGVVLGTLF